MRYYTVFKRKGQSVYQVQFWNEETGKYGSSLSVEVLSRKLGDKPFPGHANKSMALNIAERAYRAGLTNVKKSEDPLFSSYVLDFWDFEKSSYIKMKNRSKEGSIHKDYAMSMQRSFRLHAMDKLPEKLRLTELRAKHILAVQMALVEEKKLANATINLVMKSMQVPVMEAIRHEMLFTNPFLNVHSLYVESSSSRGIPTKREVEKLIEYLSIRSHESRMDMMIFLAVSLAVYTGMRNGEIRALRTGCIEFVNEDDALEDQAIITVMESIAKKAGFKSTKGKSVRKVPAPRWLCTLLCNLGRENPFGEDLIFFSSKVPGTPIVCNCITKWYYKAWNAVGMSEEERQERKIDFHSLRHFYNTQMRGKIDDSTLREIVGHKSEAMTDRYTHETQDKLIDAGRISSNIIEFKFTQYYKEKKIYG